MGGIEVVWPAPASPALLAGGARRVALLLTHDGVPEGALRRWAGTLALAAPGTPGGTRIALRCLEVRAADAAQETACAGAALALPELRRAALARVLLEATGPLDPAPPARVRVFDLWRGEMRIRPRAVATRRDGLDDVRLAFASDLHQAALFDAVAAAVRRRAPDLEGRFLDPRRLLETLVHECNARARAGELDLLVLGGDLVDHVYRTPRAASAYRSQESNLLGLLETLAPLEVPCFAIPGNHDYRLHPWRPRSYGLAESRLPRARAREVLAPEGLWDALRFRRSDLDALRSREPDGRSALAQHLRLLAPVTDFRVRVGALELVFLSTGRDVLPRWRSLEPGRRALLLRALPTTWEHPDLEGVDDAQLRRLRDGLAAAPGAAVFLHAPLLHPPVGRSVEDHVARLDPGDDDGHEARVRFERGLRRSGLRHGVFFRNAAPFVRALRDAPAPVALFSGHVHRAHAMALDPASGALRSLAFGQVGPTAERVTWLSAPALGQTDVRDEVEPGYLLARFEQGRLAAAERRVLAAA